MARVLITGGAGFIGSRTARRFLDAGHEVVAFDQLHSYVFPIQSTFLENMRFRFDQLLAGADVVRGSTANRDNLRRLIKETQPDRIVHLAALPLANVALRQTEEAFEGIVQGTENLLEILRDDMKVDRFVYVSSSMIYGDFERVPMNEDGRKDPKEIYGGMKYAGEILVKVFARRYEIPYTIVRPSAVYGPTDNNGRVLQTFTGAALRGEAIRAVDPDRTFLDFTYVEDIADGLVRAAMEPGGLNEEFNVTRGEGRSLQEAIEILAGIFPSLQVEVVREEEQFRPVRGTLDISRAKRVLGYEPRFSLEDGLAEYVEFLREYNQSLVLAG